MKSTAILTILIAGFCFSTVTCVAQNTVQPPKQEKGAKVVIGEDPVKVKHDMTLLADSIYHQLGTDQGTDLKEKKVTVTVIESGDGTGNGSTFTYTIGDSLQNKEGHKIVRSAGGQKMIIMRDGKSEDIDLTAMPATGKRYKINGFSLRDPFAFDPADTTIVSYKKKDMAKGLEKITIVRKKALAVSK